MSLKDVQALVNSYYDCKWDDLEEVTAAKEELKDYLSGCYAEIDLKKIRLMVQELTKLAELQGYCSRSQVRRADRCNHQVRHG